MEINTHGPKDLKKLVCIHGRKWVVWVGGPSFTSLVEFFWIGHQHRVIFKIQIRAEFPVHLKYLRQTGHLTFLESALWWNHSIVFICVYIYIYIMVHLTINTALSVAEY
jgi:hypothetical protein